MGRTKKRDSGYAVTAKVSSESDKTSERRDCRRGRTGLDPCVVSVVLCDCLTV